MSSIYSKNGRKLRIAVLGSCDEEQVNPTE